MRSLNPTDLSSFLAIARHKSFRRAADELGCTPSALSHALRNIEEAPEGAPAESHDAQRCVH
jgi:hypothetical protein